MDIRPLNDDGLFEKISALISNARQQIIQTVNTTMVRTYFEVGRYIVEHEQEGEARATYAKGTLEKLSKQLTETFGRGYSLRNLRTMRQFYLTYRIRQTLSTEFDYVFNNVEATKKFILSWSHYVFLMRLANEAERKFYEVETAKNHWSLRELKRQFNAALYERLALSADKEGLEQLATKGQIIETPIDLIKDPYVLDFLDLKSHSSYSETHLEQAIVDKIQDFLLELGRGFTFVARQQRISFSEKHFYIDLVFYNRILQCFVLIDLKIGELTHQDLGQMQMYVNYFDREKILSHEKQTIGLIICRSKEDTVVKYTLPKDNTQIFASRYQTILPDKEKWKRLITS